MTWIKILRFHLQFFNIINEEANKTETLIEDKITINKKKTFSITGVEKSTVFMYHRVITPSWFLLLILKF